VWGSFGGLSGIRLRQLRGGSELAHLIQDAARDIIRTRRVSRETETGQGRRRRRAEKPREAALEHMKGSVPECNTLPDLLAFSFILEGPGASLFTSF
jgi:hypothetical protein